ncbi:MAG: 2-oxoglutarate dehydrogenase E1 component [Alphaproteobacteria bacterium]|nr:2-oxoglutarate dehydrogenase E1 component [Alphaproteobacteria bacterium]
MANTPAQDILNDHALETSYLFGANSVFIEDLYNRYQQDPRAVDENWQRFFAQFDDTPEQKPSWAPSKSAVIGQVSKDDVQESAKSAPLNKQTVLRAAQDSARALMLIRAYRVRGHLIADLDPLHQEEKPIHPELEPETYGFGENDLDRPIFLDGVLGYETATMREILSIVRRAYSGKIGVEFMHISSPERKSWIQQQIETNLGRPLTTTDEKKRILKNMIEVEAFERFLHTKYPSTKRFSIEGGEAFIPGLESYILESSNQGVEEIAFGMPHRGRMNVLTTVIGKPYIELLSLFHGGIDFPDGTDSSGDVKYHLGASSHRKLANGKSIYLSMSANPSHLEAVNPVVIGKVRSKQRMQKDKERSKVSSVLLHGDAAFAGQGLVAETLSLGDLRGYTTGGTLHLIVNNQIGFTTDPKNSRFTPYPTDVAKMVQAPIFHVNGEDPEAVSFVCTLAAQYRQMFKADVVVDVFCYRKYGHNESDEPMFTQPGMYRTIGAKTSPALVYAERLVHEGTLTQEDVDGQFDQFKQFYNEQYEAARDYKPNKANWLEGSWSGLKRPKGEHPIVDTSVDEKTLKQLGKAISSYPEGFNVNSKIVRQLKAREEAITKGEGLDWASGELLAYATLLKEGYPVRISGQDVIRGTFSHRHSGLIDQVTEDIYFPLNNLGVENQATFEAINSNLSEFAVLGFEYGYSLADPNCLAIWEAQFGDFANGAQVIIDQFIASSEIKWLRMSGLVMLLPHGFEGQGPEHSSARLERYLQLCAEDNMQVVNCTTPANYFHVLRRQLLSTFRKPLIVMTPKSLLRHKRCISNIKDFAKGSHFLRLIPEQEKLVADSKIKRVLITSGKVYYDLVDGREAAKINDTAIIRIEQYYPFPARELAEELKRYKNAEEIVWVQEEPQNNGAWTFVRPFIEEVMDETGRKNQRVKYVGRKAAASPATGYVKIHEREQKALIEEAFR